MRIEDDPIFKAGMLAERQRCATIVKGLRDEIRSERAKGYTFGEIDALINTVLEGIANAAKCTWPKCNKDALCRSGNFGDQLVCDEHFKITNG